jgi:regulator of sigma E protease
MNLVFAFAAFPIVFKAGVEFTAPVAGVVEIGSPAWEERLQPGDRIVEVDGKSMYSFENMQVEIALSGSRGVVLLVERGEETFAKTVTPRYDAEAGLYLLGIDRPVRPEITAEVAEGSPAHRSGLRTGDRVLALDGAPVTREVIAAFEERTHYRRQPVTLEVERDGKRLSLSFTPDLRDAPRAEIGVVRAKRRVAGLRDGSVALSRLGLRRGDHIIEVDGRRFGGGSLDEFAVGPAELTMVVEREGEAAPVTLRAAVSPAERRALDDHVGLASDSQRVVVVPRLGSPAEAAGLVRGDAITAIDGRAIRTWEELRDTVQAADGKALELTVETGGGVVQRRLLPAERVNDRGFYFTLTELREPYRKATFSGAIAAGVVCSLDLIKSLYVTLKKLFTGEVAPSNLGGIITISRVTYIFAQSGWERFLYFLALLSINLAVINLLPIPVLDGGHLMFVLIEGIKGSPVSPRIHNYSQILGLVFILLLLLYVTYNDIVKLL